MPSSPPQTWSTYAAIRSRSARERCVISAPIRSSELRAAKTLWRTTGSSSDVPACEVHSGMREIGTPSSEKSPPTVGAERRASSRSSSCQDPSATEARRHRSRLSQSGTASSSRPRYGLARRRSSPRNAPSRMRQPTRTAPVPAQCSWTHSAKPVNSGPSTVAPYFQNG